jgi:uncharacterized coiled-coil protein SlyX
MSHITDN